MQARPRHETDGRVSGGLVEPLVDQLGGAASIEKSALSNLQVFLSNLVKLNLIHGGITSISSAPAEPLRTSTHHDLEQVSIRLHQA